MKYQIGLLLLLIVSCSDYATFKDNGSYAEIGDLEAQITKAEAEEWKVGNTRLQEVSFGVILEVEMNPLPEEAAIKLKDTYGIDSWVMRIVKLDSPMRKEIGHAYIPLFTSNARSGKSFIKISSMTARIYYSAAVTGDYRRRKCPFFGHKSYISDVDIISMDTRYNKIKTTPMRNLHKPVEKNQLVPPIFNGGTSLSGKYQIDLALYDSSKRRMFGNWTPVDNMFVIGHEKMVDISGCYGEQNPQMRGSGGKPKFSF